MFCLQIKPCCLFIVVTPNGCKLLKQRWWKMAFSERIYKKASHLIILNYFSCFVVYYKFKIFIFYTFHCGEKCCFKLYLCFKSVLSSYLILHMLSLLCRCRIWLDEKAGINPLNHHGNYLLALSSDSDELTSWNTPQVYYYQSETVSIWQHRCTYDNISAPKHIMASNVSGLWCSNFTTK